MLCDLGLWLGSDLEAEGGELTLTLTLTLNPNPNPHPHTKPP